MRLVPMNCIKPGSYLSKTIYDDEGRVLLAKGVPLTPAILHRVRQHGFWSLYIQDEYSDIEIEDIIRPELRQKAIKTVKNYYQLLDHSQGKHRREHLQSLRDVAESIVEEILAQKSIMINLVDIKSMDNYTYAHSVNVAVLSLIMGMELKYSRHQLMDLAVGAMLHDVGKIFTPREVLTKKGKLNAEEFRLVQKHPHQGYEYLKDVYEISPQPRAIVFQHHEKVNGSGYPRGLKAEDIHPYAKLVAIADVYDALTSDRPYRRAMPPNEAIEYIMGAVDKEFDYTMVRVFTRRIIPYPIGTLVQLSNGCRAVVTEVHPHLPLRPVVKVVWGNGSYQPEDTIDLYKHHSIVIKGIQHPGSPQEKENKAFGF